MTRSGRSRNPARKSPTPACTARTDSSARAALLRRSRVADSDESTPMTELHARARGRVSRPTPQYRVQGKPPPGLRQGDLGKLAGQEAIDLEEGTPAHSEHVVAAAIVERDAGPGHPEAVRAPSPESLRKLARTLGNVHLGPVPVREELHRPKRTGEPPVGSHRRECPVQLVQPRSVDRAIRDGHVALRARSKESDFGSPRRWPASESGSDYGSPKAEHWRPLCPTSSPGRRCGAGSRAVSPPCSGVPARREHAGSGSRRTCRTRGTAARPSRRETLSNRRPTRAAPLRSASQVPLPPGRREGRREPAGSRQRDAPVRHRRRPASRLGRWRAPSRFSHPVPSARSNSGPPRPAVETSLRTGQQHVFATPRGYPRGSRFPEGTAPGAPGRRIGPGSQR